MPRKKTLPPLLRPDGRRVEIENSGLEVWLYDDGESERLEATGAFAFGSPREEASGGFAPLIARGDVVAYSLMQDDALDVEVHVGKAFTPGELAKGEWLEPQTAWLRLPSGKLAIESNDALRLQEDIPGAKGVLLDVPPGNYRVTLYRVDHEALHRAEREWKGPQEVVLLTKGGSAKDAADDLLPFQPRRDLSWVGAYTVKGQVARVRAWFPDRWDTFVVNLDDAGVAKLGLVGGSVLKLTAPDAGVTLHATHGESWLAAQQFPPPDGIDKREYGVCAMSPLADWDGARALFGRRERADRRVEDPQLTRWMDATLELVTAVAKRGPPTGARRFDPTDLSEKSYYEPGFLSTVLSDVVPAVEDEDDTELRDVLLIIDDRFKKFDLRPVGEYDWVEPGRFDGMERSVRLWTGRYDSFAVLFASAGRFELVLATEYSHGKWCLTGFADEIESYLLRGQRDKALRERIRVANLDQEIGTFFTAHDKTLMAMEPGMVPSPTDEAGALAALERLLDQLATGATTDG